MESKKDKKLWAMKVINKAALKGKEEALQMEIEVLKK